MKFNSLNIFFAGAFCSTLLGCSSGPAVQEFPDTASSVEEIQNLDRNLAEAQADQVNVLSPDNFKHASQSLAKAKDRQANGKSPEQTLHLVAEGSAYLVQAKNVAKLSNDNMKEVVIARQNAINAGAMESEKKDFLEADEHLLDVTSSIEDNDLSEVAQQRTQLQSEFRDLELRAIKNKNLNPAIAIMNIANSEGGNKYAPRSQAIAKMNIENTDAFITANRYETAQIEWQSNKTKAAANHYLTMTRAVKAGKSVTGEDAALAMEAEQKKTAKANSSLKSSEADLVNTQLSVSSLKNQIDAKDEESADRAAQVASDKAFQERFENAQKMFTKQEAEVYKQNNKLLIRLRGLEFPTSKAMLKESDFVLLSKVNDVLESFGDTSVEVQGYTDSDGSKAGNQKLSTARANAVRQYFVSTSGMDEAAIEAVGFGDRNPLATNNTKLGKAQNRRVDIVITPTQETL